MQYVDDLVEKSLQQLDDEEIDSELFRAIAARLYEFQSHYESTPTYFRIMETLLDHDYFLELPLEAHPNYEIHAEDFESREAGHVHPVFRDPDREWDADDNPVAGYICNDQLYVEVGSPLWRELEEANELDPDTPDGLEEISLYRAVATVCRLARREGDENTLLQWYTALGFHMAMYVDRDDEELLEQLRDDPNVQSIREAISEIDNVEMRIEHPDMDASVPAPALRETHPILNWWYDVI